MRAVLLTTLLLGCGPNRDCQPDTVRAILDFDGVSGDADWLVVGVSIDQASPRNTVVERLHHEGTDVGIEFRSGYPAGHEVSLTVQAFVGAPPGGILVGEGRASRVLEASCVVLHVPVGQSSSDLGSDATTAAPDIAARDLAKEGDLARTLAPRQEVQSNETNQGSLNFQVNRTTMGNALVLVAAISTTSQHIAAISDDGGNTWALSAAVLPSGAGAAALEVWYVLDASPAGSITVTLTQPRNMAVHFSEWSDLAAFDAQHTNSTVESTTVSTGLVATSALDLVIGAGAFDGGGPVSTLAAGGFTELQPFDGAGIHGRAAFALRPAGSYQAVWMLSSTQTWAAEIVGFRLR
jgi:hypothetical protein